MRKAGFAPARSGLSRRSTRYSLPSIPDYRSGALLIELLPHCRLRTHSTSIFARRRSNLLQHHLNSGLEVVKGSGSLLCLLIFYVGELLLIAMYGIPSSHIIFGSLESVMVTLLGYPIYFGVIPPPLYFPMEFLISLSTSQSIQSSQPSDANIAAQYSLRQSVPTSCEVRRKPSKKRAKLHKRNKAITVPR